MQSLWVPFHFIWCVAEVDKQSPTKSCILDPIPTSLLKNSDMLDVLLPLLTKSINYSLSSGDVPVSCKRALVLPLLKKTRFGFRADEKLQTRFESAIYIETTWKGGCKSNHDLYVFNDLHVPLQSAYRPGHSTKTAMLKIKKDIDVALDQNPVSGGQCHLNHLTILRMFSWPISAYMCTKVV